MWIPGHSDPSTVSSLRHAGSVFTPQDNRGDGSSDLRQWSSFIGITTAIIGNVLISFALNIQRYAHIRIERESHESSVPLAKSGGKSANGHTNGITTQEAIAEERSKLNAEAPGPGNPTRNREGDHSLTNGGRQKSTEETSPSSRTDRSRSTDSTLQEGSGEGNARRSYLSSPYWWAGIILMTTGEAGNFLAYGFAPASIVSPLGVVALISNCIIAPFMLKERFRIRDGLGVLVAIGGAITIVLSAKNTETKLGQKELLHAILRWEFLAYVGITALMTLVLLFASPKYGDRTILIDLGLVGLFGGYTALSTKGVASLLSDTLWRTLTFPVTYFLIVVLIASALMQIRYINRALQRFDSTQVIPIQFVLFTISVIVGSAVLYRDFESTTSTQAAKFAGGCLLTFFGVYLITSQRPQEGDEGDNAFDEEETIRLIDDEDDEVGSHASVLSRKYRTLSPAKPTSQSRRASHEGSEPHTPCSAVQVTSPWSRRPDQSRSNSGKDRGKNLHISTGQSRPVTPGQPSPYTRAQSNPPQTSTFARLRPTQSHQQAFDSNAISSPPLYLRSPSQPVNLTGRDSSPTRSPRRRDGGPADRQYPAAAEAALRAHLLSSSSSLADVGNEAGSTIPISTTATTTTTTTTLPPPLKRGARSSFSRLIPGPLVNPLSSSLSAVVAESLRRGQSSGNVVFGSGGNRSATMSGGKPRGQQTGVRREKSHASFVRRGPGLLSSPMRDDGYISTPAGAAGAAGGDGDGDGGGNVFWDPATPTPVVGARGRDGDRLDRLGTGPDGDGSPTRRPSRKERGGEKERGGAQKEKREVGGPGRWDSYEDRDGVDDDGDGDGGGWDERNVDGDDGSGSGGDGSRVKAENIDPKRKGTL